MPTPASSIPLPLSLPPPSILLVCSVSPHAHTSIRPPLYFTAGTIFRAFPSTNFSLTVPPHGTRQLLKGKLCGTRHRDHPSCSMRATQVHVQQYCLAVPALYFSCFRAATPPTAARTVTSPKWKQCEARPKALSPAAGNLEATQPWKSFSSYSRTVRGLRKAGVSSSDAPDGTGSSSSRSRQAFRPLS